MILKRIIILLFLIIPLNLLCQTVKFTYDSNGNRTSMVLIPVQLKSGTINFPILDPDKLALSQNQKEPIPEGQPFVKIYPNPTKGILKIEIFNYKDESSTSLKLFDLSGVELISLNKLNPNFDLNLSLKNNGVYILKIMIDDLMFNWKIIKN
jgi:hypothetical protein